jgi:Flp pilus assembly protein TadD
VSSGMMPPVGTGRRGGTRRAWLVAALAGLSTVLIAVLAVATNLATSVVPARFERWTSDPKWMWGAAAALIVAAVVVAVLLARVEASTEEGRPDRPADEARHLVGGRLPLVREIDPLKLGAKPAMAAEDDCVEALPCYVIRDGDADLERAIAEGDLVLLHGPAAAGKSRSAFEAVRRSRPDHKLFVPSRPESLRKLAQIPGAAEGIVIWLDDLEQYLGPFGLDEAVLQDLAPGGRHDVLIVATMRDEELASLERALLSGARVGSPRIDLCWAAADMVGRIPTRRRIKVGRYLSTAELESIVDPDRDRRVSRAISSPFGFAEYLAAGPAMMNRWSTGDSALFEVGHSVISAAIDCRRAGLRDPVPEAAISRLYRHYLSAARRDRSDLPSVEAGLSWACEAVLGASSCLLPLADRTFLASDYLFDRTMTGEGPLAAHAVPDAVWQVVLEFVNPRHATQIAFAASESGREEIEEQALFLGAGIGDPIRMGLLAAFLDDCGRRAEARVWYRRAVTSDAPCPDFISLNFVALLLDLQQDAEAEQLLRTFADQNSEAADVLGRLLVQRGKSPEAEPWLQFAAGIGVITAMGPLGAILALRGDAETAELWLRRAVAGNDAEAMCNLGVLLAERADDAEAEALFRRAIELGNQDPIVNLVNLLIKRGALSEAEGLVKPSAEGGNVAAMSVYGSLLLRRGADEAEGWLHRAADGGEPTAAGNLGMLWVRQERLDDAVPLLEQALTADIPEFTATLGAILVQRGEPDQGEPHLRSAAAAGSLEAAANLGLFLAGRGKNEEALGWLRKAAQEGHLGAIANLGGLLALTGEVVEAEEHLRRAAVAGHAGAAANLGGLLMFVGDVAEAEMWCRRAAEAGNSNGERNLDLILERREQNES